MRRSTCPLSNPEEPFFTAANVADVLMPPRGEKRPNEIERVVAWFLFSFYPSEEEEARIKIFCAFSPPLISSAESAPLFLARSLPSLPRRIRMRMPNARTRIHFSCANPKTLHRSARRRLVANDSGLSFSSHRRPDAKSRHPLRVWRERNISQRQSKQQSNNTAASLQIS